MDHNPIYEHDTLFMQAFQHAPVGMALVSPEGRFLNVNPSFCKIVGYGEHELLRLSYEDITHPDDLPKNRMADGGMSVYETEKRCMHKSGRAIWVFLHISFIYDINKQLKFKIAQIVDISKQKSAEVKLKRNEQRYKALFEQHPDLICSLGKDGALKSVNADCKHMTGYTQEQFGFNFRRFFRLDGEEASQRFQAACRGEICEYELDTLHKNGFPLALRITFIPIVVDREVDGVFLIAKNITEFRRKSEKLRRIAQLHHIITEQSHDVICLMRKRIIEYVSPSVHSLLGYLPDEMIDIEIHQFVHPDDVPENWTADHLEDSDEERIDLRVRHREGHYVWFEIVVKVIRNSQGDIERLLGIGRDISERKQAEEEIRKREEGYRNLIEAAPDAVVIYQNDNWVYINDTAVRLLGGRSKEELLGTPFLRVIHPDDRDLTLERIRKTSHGKLTEMTEQRLRRRDGSTVHVESITFPSIFQGKPAVINFLRDISERKKTMELVRNSDKLSAAGQLAAGIAHEIRNPLTAIKGFVQMLQAGQGEKAAYYQIMAGEISRIEGIVSELLMLAKPQISKLEHKDIRSILEQVRMLLDTQAIMNNVQIEIGFETDRPLILECDENQIKQVLINLVKNALEAMPNGGRILVQNGEVEGWLRICVKDTGKGIPDEILGKIGQPFYTTKEKGTGLGLMVSRKIIEDHGGTFTISSVRGQGTSVELRLPLS